MDFPEEVLWQFCPGSQCPFSCDHCMARFSTHVELAADAKARVLRALLSWPLQRLALTGGEPVLHPELPYLLDIVQQERHHNSRLPDILVCTTGPRISPAVLQALRSTDAALRISLHSDGSDSPKPYVPAKAFAATVESCRRYGIRVIVNTIVFRGFRKMVSTISRLVGSLDGVSQWYILSPYATETFSADAQSYPSEEDLEAARRLVAESRVRTQVIVSGLITKGIIDVCRGPAIPCIVDCEGYVGQCASVMRSRTRQSVFDASPQGLLEEAHDLAERCKWAINGVRAGKTRKLCRLHDRQARGSLPGSNSPIQGTSQAGME